MFARTCEPNGSDRVLFTIGVTPNPETCNSVAYCCGSAQGVELHNTGELSMCTPWV
jgi:hypothetical protein